MSGENGACGHRQSKCIRWPSRWELAVLGAHGHRNVSLHGHRGQHAPVGARPQRHERRVGASRCVAARRHRGAWGFPLQNGWGRMLRGLRDSGRCRSPPRTNAQAALLAEDFSDVDGVLVRMALSYRPRRGTRRRLFWSSGQPSGASARHRPRRSGTRLRHNGQFVAGGPAAREQPARSRRTSAQRSRAARARLSTRRAWSARHVSGAAIARATAEQSPPATDVVRGTRTRRGRDQATAGRQPFTDAVGNRWCGQNSLRDSSRCRAARWLRAMACGWWSWRRFPTPRS